MVQNNSYKKTHCHHFMGYFFQSAVREVHTTAFVMLVVEHWLEQEIAQWVHHEGMEY